MLKRLSKSAAAAAIATFLAGAYIRLVNATGRGNVRGKEHFDAALADGKGVILAFWHGRMMLAAAARGITDRRVVMLISANRDGEIIARAVKSFGIETVRGSAANPKKPDKDKGGAGAVAQLLAALEAGDVVGVTPDGPRGPGEKVSNGVIRLAQLSGAPIVPTANSASRGRRLQSWDRFLAPAPLSRIVHIAGPAIRVPADADEDMVENARRALEIALTDITKEADTRVGRKDP